MQDTTNAHVKEMTSYLLCKEYSENYKDKVPSSILRWITDPGSLRFALITEETKGDKREELSYILKDVDNLSDFLMRNGRVQLVKRSDCLETLSNLKISGIYLSKTIAHYADIILRCLTDALEEKE